MKLHTAVLVLLATYYSAEAFAPPAPSLAARSLPTTPSASPTESLSSTALPAHFYYRYNSNDGHRFGGDWYGLMQSLLGTMAQSQYNPRARQSFNRRNIRYADAMRAMQDILRRGDDPRAVFERRGIPFNPFLQAMEEMLRNGGTNPNTTSNGATAPRRPQSYGESQPGADAISSMIEQLAKGFGMDPSQMAKGFGIDASQLGDMAKSLGIDPSRLGEMGLGSDSAQGGALDKYGIDFTAKAKEGKLDPCIGRDDEIRRSIQILCRRTKNNPVLIGDPGVGKV